MICHLGWAWETNSVCGRESGPWSKTKDDLPKTIENTIQKMNVIFYPNISVVLRLLLMLPYRQRQLKGAIRHSNLLKPNNVQLLEKSIDLTLLFYFTFIKILCWITEQLLICIHDKIHEKWNLFIHWMTQKMRPNLSDSHMKYFSSHG